MRLEKLHMENFRGFAELDLDFSKARNQAVLIGRNGAGKSSVLDCIGLFLGRFAGCVQDPNAAIWNPLTSRDIRHGADWVCARVSYFVDHPPGSSLTDAVSERVQGLNRFHSELLEYAAKHLASLAADRNASVPLLFYYSSHRQLGLLPQKPTDESPSASPFPPQARAYRRASSGPHGAVDTAESFQMFLRWFRTQEDIENQARLRKDPLYRSKQLGPVRAAIERFMSSLPGGEGFKELRVEREAIEGESDPFKVSERVSYLIDKGRDTFAIEQLSDGERGVLLLIADLAMRFVIANPALEDPLQGSGIVLIDEIESHLHPAWQRAILPGLTQTFPNCQFIVTTHSPQVLSEVPRDSVFLLEDFQLVAPTPHTYGRDSNAILEEVMGVPERPEEAVKRIEHIGALIDAEDLDSARRELAKLAEWLGERDAEIARLNRLIDFMT
jgi:predicted ATP-binding protein involved in virulence